jgi:DASS family divalent anion:Na+ symporter
MFSGVASLSVSSALWLTAMAANPLGTEMARAAGVEIGFGPMAPRRVGADALRDGDPAARALPRHRAGSAPHAGGARGRQAGARRARAALAPGVDRARRLCRMVALWGSAATLGLDSTAIAFLGLGALLATGVITLDDIARQGDVLATFIWFAVLFTLSSQLNELGFMGFLGRKLAAALGGLATPTAGLILVAAYILLHYLFVSQTAHLLALFGVFLEVGREARRQSGHPGVPAAVRHELFLGDHTAGIERQPAVRRQRVPDAGRSVSARRDHHRGERRDLLRRWHWMACAGGAMTR